MLEMENFLKQKANSKVFITPITLTDKVLAVTEIQEGSFFKVEITSPLDREIRFNWWILGDQASTQ